jgi:hypothetical protein
VAERKNITLYESNVERAVLTIIKQDDGTAQDITSAVIEVYIKANATTADGSAGVVKLSTETGEIVKTTPLSGICTVTFPDNIQSGTRWWRVDVILNNQRKTACYGSFTIENT